MSVTGMIRSWVMMCLILVLSMTTGWALAQNRVGQVDFVQGMTTAQQGTNALRFVAGGDPLFEGDVVTTTERGYAILSLADGTRVTLRPATTFAIDQFVQGGSDEKAQIRLLKGGMRAITGAIGKRNPDALRVATPVGNIGIRGTSFDARLCGDDCREEQNQGRSRSSRAAVVPDPDTVIGRVVQVTGRVSASRGSASVRVLGVGSPVIVGDRIVTERQSIAVIAFRDQSRVSIEPQSVFRVDAYSFGRRDTPDRSAMRLLKGGLRALSGQIGKNNPGGVTVTTTVANIGIRGTGMDISCEGPCAEEAAPVREICQPAAARGSDPGCGDGLFLHTWSGRTFISGENRELDVDVDRVGFAGSNRQARLLGSVPVFMSNFMSPRPDRVDVNWDALFGLDFYRGESGLFALVRDGFIFLDATGGLLDLGPGEGGMIGDDFRPRRLNPVPFFMTDDPYPTPESFDANDPVVLEIFGAMMGNPGQNFCAIP